MRIPVLLLTLLTEPISAQQSSPPLLSLVRLPPSSGPGLGPLLGQRGRPLQPLFVLDPRPHTRTPIRVRLRRPTTSPASTQTLQNLILNLTDSAEIQDDEEVEEEGEFLVLTNPHGVGGECRYNYHCRGEPEKRFYLLNFKVFTGRERCVRRNGRYMSVNVITIIFIYHCPLFSCTTHLCNEDRDCPDGRICRDHKCRYCRRCRDDIQASLPN